MSAQYWIVWEGEMKFARMCLPVAFALACLPFPNAAMAFLVLAMLCIPAAVLGCYADAQAR